jgi:hypothetical protein
VVQCEESLVFFAHMSHTEVCRCAVLGGGCNHVQHYPWYVDPCFIMTCGLFSSKFEVAILVGTSFINFFQNIIYSLLSCVLTPYSFP